MKARKVAETSLPTPYGTFQLLGFESTDKSESLIALVMGNVRGNDAVLEQEFSYINVRKDAASD
jgi:GTP cyclohydrolase II